MLAHIIKIYRDLTYLWLKKRTFAVLLVGWLVLNGFIVIYGGDALAVILLGFNLWFAVMAGWLVTTVKKWLDHRFERIRALEDWAGDYMASWPEQQPLAEFKRGDWVITDALLAMHHLLRKAQDKSFALEKKDRSQVFLDHQTGIGNRIYFDHRLEAYLAERESNGGGSIFLVQMQDLDIVQAQVGDKDTLELLSYFTALVNAYLEDHPDAVFARRSEFDFVLLVPRIGADDSEKIASQLLRLCNRIPLPAVVDSDHFFHIGVAHFIQSDSAYQILAEADMALRAAQLQGPSNWFMYNRGLIVKDLAKGSVQWRNAIDTAIRQQAFVLLFQPVTLTDNSIIHHHEILARMRNNNGQLVSASIFLPMAQKLDMVIRIDQLIVEKAIKLLDYEKSAQDICSLNLHMDSMLNVEFQHWLLCFLQQHPNATQRIIIEVDEYSIVTKGQVIKKFLHVLHKAGVRLLVDHVGLYVLNSQYIREFEIDYLKLHLSVIKNIDTRAQNQLFIKSLQQVCSGTHVMIFGLGVERVGEWIALQKLGVAGAQGYYFTEPLESIHQISPSH